VQEDSVSLSALFYIYKLHFNIIFASASSGLFRWGFPTRVSCASIIIHIYVEVNFTAHHWKLF